jgi:hypothetical protein
MNYKTLGAAAYFLGKGEVDSSILSGSTSGNANGSAAFRRFQAQMKRDRKSSEVRK